DRSNTVCPLRNRVADGPDFHSADPEESPDEPGIWNPHQEGVRLAAQLVRNQRVWRQAAFRVRHFSACLRMVQPGLRTTADQPLDTRVSGLASVGPCTCSCNAQRLCTSPAGPV
ncbi:hypothetical protein, partial [Sideroxydans sp. CL21]